MSHSFRKIFVIIVAVSVCGCVATRRVGKLAGKAALATPAFLAEGLWNGIFDRDFPLGVRTTQYGGALQGV